MVATHCVRNIPDGSDPYRTRFLHEHPHQCGNSGKVYDGFVACGTTGVTAFWAARPNYAVLKDYGDSCKGLRRQVHFFLIMARHQQHLEHGSEWDASEIWKICKCHRNIA